MTAVDELVAFVRAALDEDARVARAATTGPWRAAPCTDSAYAKPTAVVVRTDVELDAPWSAEWMSPWVVTPDSEGSDGIAPADAEHIARWHPARVLAEVEVKRRILDEFVSKVDEMDALIESEWGNGLGPIGESDALIKLLAQPYAGREGWREEWRLTSGS